MHILIMNSSNRLKGRRISEIDEQLTMDVRGEGRRGTVHGSQLYVVSDGGRLSRRIDEPISKQRLSTLLSATLKAKEEEKRVTIHTIPLPPCPPPPRSPSPKMINLKCISYLNSTGIVIHYDNTNTY